MSSDTRVYLDATEPATLYHLSYSPNDAAEARIKAQREEIERLKSEVERLTQENRRLNEENNALSEECDRLKARIDDRDDPEHRHIAKHAREFEAAL
jgi:predicted RNase H-like nuclease (RuvC/YqgF family)